MKVDLVIDEKEVVLVVVESAGVVGVVGVDDDDAIRADKISVVLVDLVVAIGVEVVENVLVVVLAEEDDLCRFLSKSRFLVPRLCADFGGIFFTK